MRVEYQGGLAVSRKAPVFADGRPSQQLVQQGFRVAMQLMVSTDGIFLVMHEESRFQQLQKLKLEA
jgi:hypothetical protein